ncbi:MAG: hypothetical protein WC781_05615 [Candidatus Pacearchaeota archaeon]|jgi:hypothetical protein
MNISINPCPEDKRCECCGKHISQLKPFGKEGDPLVGNFEGALLLKTFRTLFPRDKELDKELDKLDEEFKPNNYECYEEKLIEVYGKERADKITFYEQAVNTVGASWECRDCICLGDEEYFKVMVSKRKNG